MRTLALSPSFRRGFKAVMSLWLAGAPFVLAYVAVARDAGLSALEIQLMSLTVYSAATQIAIAQLLPVGTPVWTMYVTVIVMNLHHLLYGISLSKRIKFSRFERFLTSFFLTDGVYAVTIVEQKKVDFAFLLGAELSVFLAWNLFTALAILLGEAFIDVQAAHLDFAAPLTFFALLISILKTRQDVLIAVLAVGIALICLAAGLGSVAVIVVGIGAPLVGIGLIEFQKRRQKATSP